MSLYARLKERSGDLKLIGTLLGVIAAFLIILFVDFGADGHAQKLTAATAALMAVWWIFEAVPLAVTSLIPLVLFPLLGLLSGKDTADAYINSTIFLFMGGFIIALAMERWDLHKRIALNLISFFGKTPSQIVLGFMIASAFLSMWISNTATAVMILPIGLAIIYKLEEQFGEKSKYFSVALMLGIAYSCSIGGIGTLIGTPPNLVFQRVYSINFPQEEAIHFGNWILFAAPLAVLMLLISWLIINKVFYKLPADMKIDRAVIREEKAKLGKISYEEKAVLVIFILTALLWIFRQRLDLGFFSIPGWAEVFSIPAYIDDGTVAVSMGLLLFLIPSGHKESEKDRILNADVIRKIPWEIILLFGGGFALAEGFVATGLSELIGQQFSSLAGMPTYLLILIICLVITFLTELTSNTATAQIILPILASMSVQLQIDPVLLMVPATISASMAFMMPVATPPNAIVFSSERIKVHQMARTGFVLNIIGALLISVYVYFIFG